MSEVSPWLKQAMKNDRLFKWGSGRDAWCFFLYVYHPKRWGRDDGFTDFVLGFKDGDSMTIALATAEFQHGLECVARKYPNRTLHVVPIPGHEPKDKSSPPSPLESVAESLHDPDGKHGIPVVNWSRHLLRATPIREAHRARSFRRPAEEEHFATLTYKGSRLSKKDVFVLIDDVYTSGATARACRRLLEERTSVMDIAGVFLGKTG